MLGQREIRWRPRHGGDELWSSTFSLLELRLTWFDIVVGHAVSKEVADRAKHLLHELHRLQKTQERRALTA